MSASWDQQKFFASLGPMQPMAEAFLQAFLQSVQSNLSALISAQQQQNYVQIHRLAHSIKGSSRQICCAILALQAEHIEYCALNDVTQVSAALDTLLKQAERDCDSIRQFINAQR